MSANVETLESIKPIQSSKVFGIDSRLIAPILVTIILLVGQLSFGMLESYPQTALAIGISILLEIILGKIFRGKVPFLASAYISGISVGMLIRSPFFWTFALAAALTAVSKYVLRVKDRHLWNPSNFGVSATLFLAPFAASSLSIQWGNNLWAMLVIWTFGSIIMYRLNYFHITLTYVISFLFLAVIRSYVTGHEYLAEIAPLTGPMYQLYIFFMITDPKTTVRRSKPIQCLVIFTVALVEMFLRLAENVHAPYYALFIVGPIANLIDIWWEKKSESKA